MLEMGVGCNVSVAVVHGVVFCSHIPHVYEDMNVMAFSLVSCNIQ